MAMNEENMAWKAVEVTAPEMNPGRIMTWDCVALKVTEDGKRIGMPELDNVRSITFEANAGEAVMARVTMYTSCKSRDELASTLPEPMRNAFYFTEMIPAYGFNFWTVVMPVTQLSMTFGNPLIQ